jgi:hypothetical protein
MTIVFNIFLRSRVGFSLAAPLQAIEPPFCGAKFIYVSTEF